jgi:uncharacterized peroxidase-related enzyme
MLEEMATNRSEPFIAVAPGLPGIIGLFAARPQTAGPLNALAEVLLRGPSTLSRGERELIAARVSRLNNCDFCCSSHSAFAAAQLEHGDALVEAATRDPDVAPVSEKLRALLRVAGKVQRGGRHVTDADVHAARDEGATDEEIHDTVLIAAAFCMYNRYVDGLATRVPDDRAAYKAMAARIVQHGYGPAPTVV